MPAAEKPLAFSSSKGHALFVSKNASGRKTAGIFIFIAEKKEKSKLHKIKTNTSSHCRGNKNTRLSG
jgi:hypothetical protein